MMREQMIKCSLISRVVLENTCSFSVFALEELLHETLKDPQTEHLLKKPLCVCFQKEIQTALGSKWS